MSFLLVIALVAVQPPEAPLAGNLPMISPAEPNGGSPVLDRPVEVCGHVLASPLPGESMLFGQSGYLLVEDGARAPLRVGTVACVTGVVRRRDGISAQGAIDRRLGATHVSHGLNPFYLLRQCSTRAECRRMVPPDPPPSDREAPERPAVRKPGAPR